MTELEKSIHDPYPFGNDECPKCLNKTNITMTEKQFNDAIEEAILNERKRITEIMEWEYKRIKFVNYPYVGIQIKDLIELKKAFFNMTKKGDAIRKTLFKLSEMNPLSRTRIQRGH